MQEVIVKQKPLFNCSELIQVQLVKYFRMEKGKKIEITPIDLSNYKVFGENENMVN